MEYKGIKIRWLGHDGFVLEKNFKIVIDPYKILKSIEADMVMISHNHFDHMSPDDLKKVSSKKTTIVAAKECMDKLGGITCKDKIGLMPGQEKAVNGIKIKAIHAYNIDKINPDTKKPFHPKEDNKIGFLINIDGTTIYHTGDSDFIPEMNNLQPDILLVPVSGTYVMNVKDAVKAVNAIKPKVAVPMHYGSIVGSVEDAEQFRSAITNCEVHILAKEQ